MATIRQRDLPGPAFEETAGTYDEAHIENEPNVQEGVARARQPAGFDPFYVSPERRAALGISDQEEVCWKLNPAVWDETVNPLDNWLYEPGRDGRRVVTRQDGSLVKNLDVILCAYPKQEDVEWNQQKQRETAEFVHNLEHGDLGNTPRWRTPDKQELRDMTEMEVANNAAAGLIGEFANVPWQRVMSMIGRDEWEKMERQHLKLPTRSYPDDGQAERQDKARAERQSRANTTYSIPNNVRPRNFKGAAK